MRLKRDGRMGKGTRAAFLIAVLVLTGCGASETERTEGQEIPVPETGRIESLEMSAAERDQPESRKEPLLEVIPELTEYRSLTYGQFREK